MKRASATGQHDYAPGLDHTGIDDSLLLFGSAHGSSSPGADEGLHLPLEPGRNRSKGKEKTFKNHRLIEYSVSRLSFRRIRFRFYITLQKQTIFLSKLEQLNKLFYIIYLIPVLYTEAGDFVSPYGLCPLAVTQIVAPAYRSY